MNKYQNDKQKIYIESPKEQNEKIILREFEKPIYSIKSKYYNNDENIIKKTNFNIPEEEKNLDNNENNNLNDCILFNKKLDKNILLNEILDIICNLPGINIKTLRKMLHINSNNFFIEKNIITYMINMGLLYAQDFDEKNSEVNDDTKLFPYSNINLFI